MRLDPTRPISLPRFAVVGAALATFVACIWLILTPMPPWWYLDRSIQLGWVPAAWQRRYVGEWRHSRGESGFRPCPGLADSVPSHAGGEWWLTFDARAKKRLDARLRPGAVPHRDTAVMLSILGELSPDGRYGHLGRYSREFNVLAVYDVRAVPSGGCAALHGDSALAMPN